MVQNLSSLSVQHLSQHVAQVLGISSSVELRKDLEQISQHFNILEPAVGKQFWHAGATPAGIYIILDGKVRVLDQTDRLITTLQPGTSFGELSLFPEENFQPHKVRASVHLKLCFIPKEILQFLISKYPEIEIQLHQRAVDWDLLMLCHQALNPDSGVDGIINILPLLKRYQCPIGPLSKELIKPLHRQQVWLLRQGELRHPSGHQLMAGRFYPVSQLPQDQAWRALQPTELYVLSQSNWNTVLRHVPELASVVPSAQDRADPSVDHSSTPEWTMTAEAFDCSQPDRDRKSAFSSKVTGISKAYFPRPAVRLGLWWQRTTRRYPFFQQQSASDCGAACLVIVGRYWGKRFNINRLRDIANVDRNGASLRGLTAAAESIGFTTRPVRASLNRLAQQHLPSIVHWEGKHYIVVFEVTRDRVIVVDPAIGQLRLSHAAFKAGWTGYALLLQPTSLLENAEEASQPFWQFMELVKPHWLVLLEILVASILIQVFGLITPIFTQLLLDRVVVQQSNVTLTAIGLGLLIFGLFRVIITGLRQYLLDHTANRVDLVLIVGFITHTFRLPLSFFESRYVGDIISRVQENRKIQRFITGEALSIGLDLLTVFIYVALMFWYSWKMALMMLVIVPPFVLLALMATPFLQRVSREIFNAFNEEMGYLIQSLSGVRTVKSMAVERTVRWQWEDLFGRSIKKAFSGQMIGNVLQMFSGAIEAIATTVLLWFGAWQVIQGELTIGQLVAFNMLLANVITPFQRLTVLWSELQDVIIAIERINDVIDTAPEEDLQHQSRQSLPPLQGHIHFEQVTFRYHPESDVNTIENISFTVQPGQTVALVGRSGSGKTTLSKLLLGLYPPTEGKIFIDGYDVTSLSLRSLRQQIGVVDQDTFLFGGTIRENIGIGHPSATLEDMIEVAKLAGAHAFIKDLPMGYETQIGEGGNLLSGGQRQRLAIARALLGNPQLLILDEATSHLDAESERIIQTNLDKILQGRTTIIIAHRLSTIRNADLILVLDRGVLVESGTHNELMQRQGHYFYLNQQQLTHAIQC